MVTVSLLPHQLGLTQQSFDAVARNVRVTERPRDNCVTSGDKLICMRDISIGFGSEVEFSLSAHSIRTLPCVVGKGDVNVATNFVTKSIFGVL